ncbi:MAG: beta-glucosidase BglX [Bacteroidota bacterium]
MKQIQNLILAMTLITGVIACGPTGEKTDKTDDAIDKKVDSVLSLMNLDEKIGQMNQYNGSWDVTGPVPDDSYNKERYEMVSQGHVGSMLNVLYVESTRAMQELAVNNSRLGIPLIFGHDVIHGFKTIFPIPLGEASSWDLDAIKKSARIAAIEASAAGQHWTFAPMVDISRDPRWGRVMEGAGEDPYLGSRIAVARINGFQGEDLSEVNTLAACAKHFAGYGFSEAGRDYNTVDISKHTLHNLVLPPFKAAVYEANVATFMNAFNEIGGVPATGSEYLQRDILKEKWGFNGFVVSDWGSIGEMIAHGFATDLKEAAEIAVEAGSDMDMESNAYLRNLKELVENGEVDESLIDDAVRRILRVKFELGLFDDPFKYCDEAREKELLGHPDHMAAARDVAKKSIVLLKNENQLLPLDKNTRTIAVIGPLADHKDAPIGNWRSQGEAFSAVSLLEGVKNAVGPNTNVLYSEGYRLNLNDERGFMSPVIVNETDRSGFAEAKRTAAAADVVLLAVGEDAYQSGEARSRSNIDLPGLQHEFIKEIYEANKNIVLVLMNGRPLIINWEAENLPAILETWLLGSEAGNAIADVVFGDFNPSGKLPVTFPRALGQVPNYYNYKNTGRPYLGQEGGFTSSYIDIENDPLFPFGYGLSYTTFDIRNLQLNTNMMNWNDTLNISVEVENTGNYDGHEVVQLYIRDMVGSVTRPVKELKGFEKVFIEKGETIRIDFKLSREDLSFYNDALEFVAEPGDFTVFVGSSSADGITDTFVLNKE